MSGVREDPDDLGYFFIDEPRRGGSAPPRTLLARCNSILLPGEQRAIMAAALASHRGDYETAERARARTEYDGLPFRPDVDGEW